MRTKTWIVLLLSLLAFTAKAAVIPIKITDFPRTNTIPADAFFLIAITNSVENTNYGFTYTNLFRQITSAIPVVVNSFTNGSNFFIAGSDWTNIGGFVRLLGGSTNTARFDTNNNRGMLIGDTNIAMSYFGWPSDTQSYLSVYDGTAGKLDNKWTHGIMQISTTNGSYATLRPVTGVNPSLTEAFVVLTNGVIASEFDINMQRTGSYLLLGGNVNDGFVGIQHGAQVSTPIGPNLIRAKWGTLDRFFLSTNGNVSFFGSHTNYGTLYARSNFVVVGTTVLNGTLAVGGPALFLNGLGSTGITNTIGFQTLGRISLGNSTSDLTTSSNTLRQYGPTYLHDASLTPNRVLYIDSGSLVATATMAPTDLTTASILVASSNAIVALIGGGSSLWTNQSDLSILRPIAGSTNVIGGGTANTIDTNNTYATIGGGTTNTIGTNSSFATISGGSANVIDDPQSTIGGGFGNSIVGTNTTIGGGYGNRAVLGNSSGGVAIAGGEANLAADAYVTIAGGIVNSAYSPYSVIGGGGTNTILGATLEGWETIAGGVGNTMYGSQFATIGGGAGNVIATAALASTIAGGRSNYVQSGVGTDLSAYNFLGGGYSNGVVYPSSFSVIAGGEQNTMHSWHGFIGSGYLNTIYTNALFSVIAGGGRNSISTNSTASTISGGTNNSIQANAGYSVIGGGVGNSINGSLGGYVISNAHAVIGGGLKNTNNALLGVIGGGYLNTIQSNAYLSVISGGSFSIIQTNSASSVIAGGSLNSIGSFAQDSVISGGGTNRIGTGSSNSVIVGGFLNVIGNNAPNAVAIGSYLSVTNANAIELGTDTSGNKVRIDTTNMTMVGGMQFRMEDSAGEGKVLTSDSLGRGRWAAGGGGGGSGSMTNVTNSVWVDAGAMRSTHGSTADGGLVGATTGSWTNAISIWDTWDFDDTTNECVQFRTTLDRTFTGPVYVDLHWVSTNTLNGASNVVWNIAMTPLATNNLAGSWIYQTNLTTRFWSSNSLQIATMPTITLTNYAPRHLIDFRISRFGTNTADAALGDARLVGAQISYITSQ